MRRAIIVAVLAALAAAPAAEAACGGVVRSYPREPLGNYRPPPILGDSATIFPVPRLARIGVGADARGCRPFSEGLRVVRARRRARTLPHLVVLARGSNGSVSNGELERALRLVGRRRVLGLVTPREPGGADAFTRLVRAELRRYAPPPGWRLRARRRR